MLRALVWLGGGAVAVPSPLCVSLCTLNTEVLWTSCLSVGTWALSLPLQGLLAVWEQPLSNLGVVGGWEENPDPSPAEAREEASGSPSDRSLSFPTPLGTQKRK